MIFDKYDKKRKAKEKELNRREGSIVELEQQIARVSKALEEALAELSEMKPDDTVVLEWKTDKDGTRHPGKVMSVYDTQVRAVDTLTKDLNALIERRDAVMYPRRDNSTLSWNEKINPTDIIKTILVITASGLQSYVIFKVQRDGHLIKRDAAMIQMPRP